MQIRTQSTHQVQGTAVTAVHAITLPNTNHSHTQTYKTTNHPQTHKKKQPHKIRHEQVAHTKPTTNPHTHAQNIIKHTRTSNTRKYHKQKHTETPNTRRDSSPTRQLISSAVPLPAKVRRFQHVYRPRSGTLQTKKRSNKHIKQTQPTRTQNSNKHITKQYQMHTTHI